VEVVLLKVSKFVLELERNPPPFYGISAHDPPFFPFRDERKRLAQSNSFPFYKYKEREYRGPALLRDALFDILEPFFPYENGSCSVRRIGVCVVLFQLFEQPAVCR